jgi:hypothetical protein
MTTALTFNVSPSHPPEARFYELLTDLPIDIVQVSIREFLNPLEMIRALEFVKDPLAHLKMLEFHNIDIREHALDALISVCKCRADVDLAAFRRVVATADLNANELKTVAQVCGFRYMHRIPDIVMVLATSPKCIDSRGVIAHLLPIMIDCQMFEIDGHTPYYPNTEHLERAIGIMKAHMNPLMISDIVLNCLRHQVRLQHTIFDLLIDVVDPRRVLAEIDEWNRLYRESHACRATSIVHLIDYCIYRASPKFMRFRARILHALYEKGFQTWLRTPCADFDVRLLFELHEYPEIYRDIKAIARVKYSPFSEVASILEEIPETKELCELFVEHVRYLFTDDVMTAT